MKSLSFVIPAYNEAENIMTAIEKTDEAFSGSDARLNYIVVDDGSTDDTWRTLVRAAETDGRISGVRFSRNFGKEAAIFAGLSHARGDACIVMDCDLRHPPAAARRMYDLWRENPHVEIVEGIKRSRGDESLGSKLFAGVFYRFFNNAAGRDLTGSSDFKLLSRTAVDELLRLPERFTFFRALSGWIGFETAQVEFDVEPRAGGETKWSFFRLLKYGISSVSSFSSAPMQIVTVCGLVFLLFTVILAVQTLWRFFSGQSLEGFTTVILILLFSGSIIMLSLGVIGYYVSRIYDELKRRPRYIVSGRINAEEKRDITMP